jgi:hypothetical protein
VVALAVTLALLSMSIEDTVSTLLLVTLFSLIGIAIAFIVGMRRFVLAGVVIACLLTLLVFFNIASVYRAGSR